MKKINLRVLESPSKKPKKNVKKIVPASIASGLMKDGYGKGQEFLKKMKKTKPGDKRALINMLLSEETIVNFLYEYLLSPRYKKTALDFCQLNGVPFDEYQRIIKDTTNLELLYLNGMLVTHHKNKLYNQIEDTGRMPHVTGADIVLRKLYNDGEWNEAHKSKTNIVLNFSGISPQKIEHINSLSEIFDERRIIDAENDNDDDDNDNKENEDKDDGN